MTDFDGIADSVVEDKSATLARMEAWAQDNPNGMQHWFPAVLSTEGVNWPATKVVAMPVELQSELLGIIEGGVDPTPEVLARLDEPAKEIAAFVARHGGKGFLRTGTTSMKHSWSQTCFLENAELSTAREKMGTLVTESLMMAPLSNILVVRELIETQPVFTAFEGMPVTREFRFFADKEGWIGHQFYWPKNAFENQRQLPEDWESRLDSIGTLSEDETRELGLLAKAVTGHLEGPWSVDFLQDKHGTWYQIDMARMQDSYLSSDVIWSDYGKDFLAMKEQGEGNAD